MAMRTQKADEGGGAEEVNLTPMIDITFQLLIFFMVTSQMAELDNIAELHLPKADAAKPSYKPPKERLVINVIPRDLQTGSGAVYIVGGDERDLKRLQLLIYREAEILKGPGGYSSRPVLIRADERVHYKHIQHLMNLCMDYKIWKLSFGAAAREP